MVPCMWPCWRRFDGAEDTAGISGSMDFIESLVEAEVGHWAVVSMVENCEAAANNSVGWSAVLETLSRSGACLPRPP